MPLSNQLELRHIRYFLAVAEELHFRKAADKLFISQPGLSRQIKKMEADLGIQLFKRHNRNVELTEAGIYLNQEFRRVLVEMEGIISHAQLIQKGMLGQLRFGYIGSAMQTVIPEFMLKIRAKYPQVRFDLKEMDNQHQIQAIKNREIDFGFVRMDRVPRGIQMQTMFEDTFSVVLPNDHPVNESNFKGIDQLKSESFILFDATYSTSYYEKVMQIFDDAGFVPKISHKTVQANTIYRLIEKKFGVAIVPTSLKQGYDLDVKFIEMRKLRQRTTLKIIWNSKTTNPLLTNVVPLI